MILRRPFRPLADFVAVRHLVLLSDEQLCAIRASLSSAKCAYPREAR